MFYALVLPSGALLGLFWTWIGQGAWRWPSLITVCIQKCPKTRFGDPGAFWGLAATQKLQFHYGSIVNSAFQALGGHSKAAFSLRIYSEFCFSSAWLPLKIRIFAAVS